MLERVQEHGDLFAPVVELRQELPAAVRIRELVLPAADPACRRPRSTPVPSAAPSGCAWRPAVRSHWATNVPPQRFEEAVEYARERARAGGGGLPVSPDWRSRAAYFYDPGGNIVELIARERAPGEELFLELSEVGLPVADVGAAVAVPRGRARAHALQRRPARTSARSVTIAACSIVVTVGRPWLFTDQPAPPARRCA